MDQPSPSNMPPMPSRPTMMPPDRIASGGYSKWVIFGATAIVVVLIAAVVVTAVILYNASRLKQLPPRTETLAEKSAETAASFAEASDPTAHPAYNDIHAMFDRFAKSMQNRNQVTYSNCFDAKRWIEEAMRLDEFPKLSASAERATIVGFEKSIGQQVRNFDDGTIWKSFRIIRIVDLDDPDEVRVIVRARIGLGFDAKVRCWLRRTETFWRIYDFEDLDSGLRGSTTSAIAMAGAMGGTPPAWINAFQRLIPISTQIAMGDFDSARRTMTSIRSIRFPAQIESYRQIVELNLAVAEGDWEAADKVLSALQRMPDTPPVTNYIASVMYNMRGEHEKALESAQRYAALLGADAEVQLEIGEALLALKRNDEAADAYRAGLDENPDDAELLLGLVGALPAGQTDELAQRFGAVSDKDAVFDVVAARLVYAGSHLAAFRAVADVYAATSPKSASLHFYRGIALQTEGKTDEAVDELQKAVAGADEREQFYYMESLQDALIKAGRFADAYAANPNASESFDNVAYMLMGEGNTIELRKLIAAHEANQPDDVTMWYYKGELAELEGDSERALEAYRTGRTRTEDLDEREMFTNLIVTKLFEQGSLEEAYRECATLLTGPDIIAQLCMNNEDTDKLSALIALHEAKQPDDMALHLWRAQHAFLNKNYDEVVTIARPHFDDLLNDYRFLESAEYVIIRSLARLKQFDEARQIAEASTARHGDPFYEFVVDAVDQNIERAKKSLARCEEYGYPPMYFLMDPDVKAALENTALREALAIEDEMPSLDEADAMD